MSQSLLENEILEQPAALSNLINEESVHALTLAQILRGSFNYIMIAARGTSDNAARYAQYLFQMANRIPVALATPSVFSVYKKQPDLSGALVLAISQSGMSPDILSVVEEGKRQGRPSVAITNDLESPLAQIADDVIPLHAGPERAVAATKTYTTSLAAMALLSYGFADDPDMLKAVEKLPGWVESTLVKVLPLTERMERYRFMDRGVVIGRGYNYCTAFEIALKVKELTGVTTVPYSSADFLHGPVATVHDGYPVLAIAHSGEVQQDMLELLQKVRGLGAEVIVISDVEEAREFGHLSFAIPEGVPEWLSPVVNVLPGQILGWQLAIYKGLDPDRPKGLSKVTETV